MTFYKSRTGVVLSEIAGEYVLVAAKALEGQCPYVTQINESSAFLWKCLESGASVDELQAAAAEEYELEDPTAVREAICSIVQQMKDLNYLIEESTGG